MPKGGGHPYLNDSEWGGVEALCHLHHTTFGLIEYIVSPKLVLQGKVHYFWQKDQWTFGIPVNALRESHALIQNAQKLTVRHVFLPRWALRTAICQPSGNIYISCTVFPSCLHCWPKLDGWEWNFHTSMGPPGNLNGNFLKVIPGRLSWVSSSWTCKKTSLLTRHLITMQLYSMRLSESLINGAHTQGFYQLVHQPHLLSLPCRNLLASQQQVQGVGQGNKLRHSLRACAPWQYAQHHLRNTKLGLLVVNCNAVVAVHGNLPNGLEQVTRIVWSEGFEIDLTTSHPWTPLHTSKPPPKQLPMIAATIGFLLSAIDSITFWPPMVISLASSTVLAALIMLWSRIRQKNLTLWQLPCNCSIMNFHVHFYTNDIKLLGEEWL